MTESDIIEILNKKRATMTQIKLASELGISPSYLSMVLSKGRGISARLARALGYQMVVKRTATKIFTPIL